MSKRDYEIVSYRTVSEVPNDPHYADEIAEEVERQHRAALADAIIKSLEENASISIIEANRSNAQGSLREERRMTVSFISNDKESARLAGSILDAELSGMRRAAAICRAHAARYTGLGGPCGHVIKNAFEREASEIEANADHRSRKHQYWRPMTSREFQHMREIEFLYEDGTISDRDFLRKIRPVKRALAQCVEDAAATDLPYPTRDLAGFQMIIEPVAWRGKLRR